MSRLRVLIPNLDLASAVFGEPTGSYPGNASIPYFVHSLNVVLWADEVLLAQSAFINAQNDPYFVREVDRECVRSLMDKLHSEGVIETFDPTEKLPALTRLGIQHLVALDLDRHGCGQLAEDESGKRDLRQISIGGRTFCMPQLASLYAAMAIGEFHGALPMLPNRLHDTWAEAVGRQDVRRCVLEATEFFLPSMDPGPYGLFCREELAASCKHMDECKGAAREQTSRLTDDLLIMRNDPAVRGLCQAVRKAAEALGEDANTPHLIEVVYSDITRSQASVLERFAANEKVRKWASPALYVTGAAIDLFGTLTGHPLAGTTGAVTVGLGAAATDLATSEARKRVEDKRVWKSFAQRHLDYSELTAALRTTPSLLPHSGGETGVSDPTKARRRTTGTTDTT